MNVVSFLDYFVGFFLVLLLFWFYCFWNWRRKKQFCWENFLIYIQIEFFDGNTNIWLENVGLFCLWWCVSPFQVFISRIFHFPHVWKTYKTSSYILKGRSFILTWWIGFFSLPRLFDWREQIYCDSIESIFAFHIWKFETNYIWSIV